MKAIEKIRLVVADVTDDEAALIIENGKIIKSQWTRLPGADVKITPLSILRTAGDILSGILATRKDMALNYDYADEALRLARYMASKVEEESK